MNSLFKQRIIGAVVLVSLGVIFIPILLTGKGDFSSTELKSNIPPMPMYEIKAPDVLALPSKPAIQPAVASLEPAELTRPPQAQTQEPTTITIPIAKPQPETSKAMTPLPEKAVAEINRSTSASQVTAASSETAGDKKTHSVVKNQVKEQKTEVQAPPTNSAASSVKEPIVAGWVVQIGSFTVKKNALKLRDKLRKNGHASFVESFNKNNGMIYRVRVGPELTKDLAEELNQTLGNETQLKGLVMRYPQ